MSKTLLLIGAAAVVGLFLMAKKASATTATSGTSAPYATPSLSGYTIAQPGVTIVTSGANTPTSTAEQIKQIAQSIASGASAKAGAAEIKTISLGTPTSSAQVAANISSGVMNINTGGASAIWTGSGFFNPYTGITHVPTTYA